MSDDRTAGNAANEDHAARVAAEMRANLRKRKARQRARAEGARPERPETGSTEGR